MREELLQVPIIAGSCLLTSEEIPQLIPESTTDDLKRLCGNHPNADDLNIGDFTRRHSPYKLYYWLETREFANLEATRTKGKISDGEALPVLIDEACRIEEAVPRNPEADVRFLYTHKPEVNGHLSELAEKYAERILQILDKRNVPLSPRLREMINMRPGGCDFLKIICTYSPGAIGEDTAIVIEPAKYHIPDIEIIRQAMRVPTADSEKIIFRELHKAAGFIVANALFDLAEWISVVNYSGTDGTKKAQYVLK